MRTAALVTLQWIAIGDGGSSQMALETMLTGSCRRRGVFSRAVREAKCESAASTPRLAEELAWQRGDVARHGLAL